MSALWFWFNRKIVQNVQKFLKISVNISPARRSQSLDLYFVIPTQKQLNFKMFKYISTKEFEVSLIT